MSESLKLNSVPLVYNPDRIIYPEDNRFLLPSESARLDQFIQQFLELKHKGVITTDHLDLSKNFPVSSGGDSIILPLHMSNPFIKEETPPMAAVDQSQRWFKLLNKLGLGEKILGYMEHPQNKRFAPAVLLHEDLHQRLEKEVLGSPIPIQFCDIEGVTHEIANNETGKLVTQRNTTEIQRTKSVMSELSKKGFTFDDVRKLITLYYIPKPSEFFTTSLEAIVQLKCREEITPEIAKNLGFSTVEEAKVFLHDKLAHYTKEETALTNALKEACSNVSPAFKDMMSKIDTHWDDVAPLLLKHFTNAI